MAYVQFNNIPVTRWYDYPPGVPPQSAWYSARIHYAGEGGVPARRPPVIFNHGTGATGHMEDSDPIIVRLLADGFNVVSFRNFGAGTSSDAPWTGGYGNVNAPNLFSSFVRGAYRIQSAIEFVEAHRDTYFTGDRIRLMGQSGGASACVAWSGMSPLFLSEGKVSAIFANGVAIAGLGGKRWNDVNRGMAAISDVLSRVRHPTLLSWGDEDDYAPPDVHRRYQLANRLYGNDKLSWYFPGSYGHSWLPDNPGVWGPVVASFFDQEYEDARIQSVLDRFSSTLTPGRASAIRGLVQAGISGGWWDDLDALQVYAAPTMADALIDWVNPSRNPTITGTVELTPDRDVRATPAGGYLLTGFNPGDSRLKSSLNDMSMGIWQNEDNTAAATLGGALQGADYTQISFAAGRLFRVGSNSSTSFNNGVTVADTRGLFAMDRPDGATVNLFDKGALALVGERVTTAIPNLPFYVMGRNTNGTPSSSNTRRISAFFYGRSMGAVKQTALYTALAAYMAAIGNT